MSVEEIYREVILDHYRNPRHRGSLETPDAHGDGTNPLCGDEVAIDVELTDGRITDIAVLGTGCAISQASASMMTDAVLGKSIDEVAEITHRFKRMMDIEEGDAGLDPERPGAVLGDLEVLSGVRRLPVRIKCADLAWTTLQTALDSEV